MLTTRTTPATLDLLKELKLEDLTIEDVIARFKAVDAIPMTDVINGVLNNNLKYITLYMTIRYSISSKNREAISDWAKSYFQDILSLREDAILKMGDFPNNTPNELFLLGEIFRRGFGTKINHKMTFHFYQLSASRESHLGIVFLAACYRDGIGTAKDPHKARELLSKLSTREARDALAYLIETDFPAEKEEALRNYILGAIDLCPFALCNLAICFTQEYGGLKYDKTTIRQLAATAASLGSRVSMLSFAKCIDNENQWKLIRLADDEEAHFRIRDAREFHASHPPSALTYHAAFALKETKDAKELARLKSSFLKLCNEEPGTVKKLMQDLGDTEDDILEMLLDEKQKNWLSLLCLYQKETAFLTRDVFNIVVRYLDFPVFVCPFVLQKEDLAKNTMQFLLTQSISSLFVTQAARAERREITYQMAIRNVF